MSEVDAELFYTKDHEWVLIEDNVVTVGITDHAQDELGDITYVELPEDDAEFGEGDEVCTIESVKASSPVFAPLSGQIIEVNSELDAEPGAVNSDCYGAGWIFKMEIVDASEIDNLMNAEDYEDYIA